MVSVAGWPSLVVIFFSGPHIGFEEGRACLVRGAVVT